MEQLSSLVFVIGIFSCVDWINGTHFRGGTISWKHLNSYGNDTHELEFEYRLGWRNTYPGRGCDWSAIASQTLGFGEGAWTVSSYTGSYSLHSTDIICTVFEPYEDWMYGYSSFVSNITSSSPFNITFSDCCWISTLYFGADSSWSIGTQNIELRLRSDTRKTNNPPVTFSPPIVRLQRGCPSNIIITSTDADGDRVTCRYATGDIECRGICGEYEHFTLDEENCIIRYDGGGGNYLVPVAVMLEDHPRQSVIAGGSEIVTTSDHFSEIPLQFLVQIESGVYYNQSCNVKPSYPEYAAPDGSVIAVSKTGSFNETLYAYPSAPGTSINRFIIIGPLGMQQTPVYYLGEDLYASDVTWTPTREQKGDHNMCYYAVDAYGKSSDQRCLTIAVAGTSSTCDVENGGCSDECIPFGDANTCSCSHPCWVLARDRRTCVPRMNVTCSGANIDISVTGCATDKTIVAGAERDYFSENSCQSIERLSGHHLNFQITECGTDIQLSAQGVQYGISIWTWEGEFFEGSGQGSVITRGEWQNIRLSCTIPSSVNLTASFLPVAPINTEYLPKEVAIEGMGSFTLYFDLYRTNNFTSVYGPSDYPIEVTINQEIYFKLGAFGRGGLVLLTEECIAMSTPTLTPSSLTYYFIRDGCLIDPTVRSYASSNLMENLFSIKAFQFQAKLLERKEDSSIYIQCQILLCDTSINTRCTRGCIPSSRRKRDTEEVGLIEEKYEEEEYEESPSLSVSQSPPQSVSNLIILIIPNVPAVDNATGVPTLVYDDDGELDGEKEVPSADKTSLILGITTGVALALVIFFLAFYFLKVRKTIKEGNAPVKI